VSVLFALERKERMTGSRLSTSKLKYLIVLNALDQEDHGVRSTVLAKCLQVSRPSVHSMLQRLKEIGCVEKEHYGVIYLTHKGREIAEHYTPQFQEELQDILQKAHEA